MDVDKRFQEAVQSFWTARRKQQQKQIDGGRIDAGTRGAVTGGTQMGALEVLTVDILKASGLKEIDIRTRTGLELPGYFRPEKKWDLIVVSNGQLICAIEFKSMVGSFGKNLNNRTEESIGNAVDIWTAYREGLLGTRFRPFLGYFFLLEDHPEIHKLRKATGKIFSIDPIFQNASYAQRYEILCQRLVLERHYEGACLTLATDEETTRITHPNASLGFRSFAAELEAVATRFLRAGAP